MPEKIKKVEEDVSRSEWTKIIKDFLIEMCKEMKYVPKTEVKNLDVVWYDKDGRLVIVFEHENDPKTIVMMIVLERWTN